MLSKGERGNDDMSTGRIMFLVLSNGLAWLLVHMGFAWVGTRVPASAFNPRGWLFRSYRFEGGGRLYEVFFRVKAWKGMLPDGATWVKGFPKKTLASADEAYVERFIVETCRGELVHWAVFLAAGLFFLWNEARVGWIMVGYGVLANAPCIVVQRYNRARLRRIQARRRRYGTVK